MDVIGRARGRSREAVAHVRDLAMARYLLEMKTYRYRGHSMSDPAKYRTREEVQEMREHHDPIASARARLLEMGVPESELKQAEDETRAQMQQAAEFAQSSPEPDAAELWTDILVSA